MVKCPFCGFDNEDGALFCEQCKSDLSAVPATPAAAVEVVDVVAVEAVDVEPVAVEAVAVEAVEAAPAPAIAAAAVAAAAAAAPVAPAPAAAPAPEPVAAPAAAPAPAAAAPAAAGGPSVPPGSQPKLSVIRGQKVGVEFPIYAEYNYIGRADDKPVDVDLEDQEPPDRVWTSRQHAVIHFDEAAGIIMLEDLNSANGTFETGQITTPEQKEAGTGKVLQSAATYRGQPSKVNDKDGTPIEIAAVVVYRIVDAAQSVFQVDDLEVFIHMQSEAVLRDIASHYSYDAHEGEEYALRGHIEQVSGRLKTSLQERMHPAGVEVMDARISHLAYATEIAGAMLQRQQASATIAARQKIVEGAVGMVELAIHSLEQKSVVTLDPERKAALVSNLLVVLCGHSTPQPIVNTGAGR